MKTKIKIDEKKLFVQCAKCGFSYADLARELGVTNSSVYGIRKRNLRPDTVGKVARALGCEPEDILENEVTA